MTEEEVKRMIDAHIMNHVKVRVINHKDGTQSVRIKNNATDYIYRMMAAYFSGV